MMIIITTTVNFNNEAIVLFYTQTTKTQKSFKHTHIHKLNVQSFSQVFGALLSGSRFFRGKQKLCLKFAFSTKQKL